MNFNLETEIALRVRPQEVTYWPEIQKYTNVNVT